MTCAATEDEWVNEKLLDWIIMQNRNPFDPPQPFNQQTSQNQQEVQGQQAQGQFQPQPNQGQAQQPPLGYGQPQFAHAPHNNQSQPPRKNWFLRHKILTAILAIAAIIIIASVAGGGGEPDTTDGEKAQVAAESSEKATAENSPTEEAEKKEEKSPEPEEPAGFRIGDTATAGDMTYVVKKVKTGDSVGSSFLEEKAKGKYVIVSVEVTNNSTEAAMVTSSFFKLKSGDKTFEADSMASIAATSDSEDDSFFAEELNPDLTMTGVIVFDVSDKVASAKDNVLQAQTGFWGTETVDILLAK